MIRPRLIPAAKAGVPGDRGVLEACPIAWEIARWNTNVLAGVTAVLLEIAEESVAQGVETFSNFANDPLHRLRGTLLAVLVVTFGDTKQAEDMSARIQKIHRQVQGTLRNGSTYSALDPKLDLWVYATLVEMALDAYHQFIRPLTWDERAAYYDATEPFGTLFGVTDPVRPSTYNDFVLYYRDKLDVLVVTPGAREIATKLFHARLGYLPVWPFAGWFAAAFMPTDRLRQAYDLRWNRCDRLMWALATSLIRLATRIAPPLFQWQHYRVGKRRITQSV